MKSAGALDRRIHQGNYGEAFVRVLAASAGLVVYRPEPDTTGEDFIIAFPGFRGSTRHPKIEVQVKSWSVTGGNDLNWRYRMRADHYNELAGDGFYLPRFLFLIVVPEDSQSYATASSQSLSLQHAAYWVSFAGNEHAEGVQTVTVDVPRRNLLTVEVLRSLFPEAPLTLPRQRS